MKHHKFLIIVTKNENDYSISQNGKVLDKKLEKKFINFWLKIAPRMRILLWVTIFQLYFLYFVSLLVGDIFMPNQYAWGMRHMIYYILCPYFIILVSYFPTFLYYLMVVCACFKIKQKFLMKKLKNLAKKCSIQDNRNNWKKFVQLKVFVENIENSINLVNEIAIFNAFWSPYASIYYIIYTVEIAFIFVLCLTSLSYHRVTIRTAFGSTVLLFRCCFP